MYKSSTLLFNFTSECITRGYVPYLLKWISNAFLGVGKLYLVLFRTFIINLYLDDNMDN